MEIVNGEQRSYIEQNIQMTQEIKRLQAEVNRLTGMCKTSEKMLDAVIAAFFVAGAPAPNITQECWDSGKTYQIVQNDDFFTISRSEEEAKKERIQREYEEFLQFLKNSRRKRRS